MKTFLTLPPAVHARILDRVSAAPGRIVELAGGVRRSAAGVEVFLPLAALDAGFERAARGAARVRLGSWPHFMERTPWTYWKAFPLLEVRPGLLLEVGLLPGGGFCGATADDGVLGALDEIRLPGPGMQRWRAAEGIPPDDREIPRDGRHSRLAGALGGMSILCRIQESTFGLAGVGRTGSLLAHSLARMGVRRIVLVDPDVVELHNLDDTDGLSAADVGKPKVLALAEFLRGHFPAIEVFALPAGIEEGAALDALAGCDVLVTAPDSGHARLIAAALSVLHLRPHLDVGTGVFRGGERQGNNAATRATVRRPDGAPPAFPLDAGADVRLVLPDEGCLLCAGGIRRPARAPRAADWRTERAGSLRSLNQVAAHLGLHLLERLYTGDLQSSSWQQLRTGPAPMPFTLASIPIRPDPSCPLCRRAGLGDLGLPARRSRDPTPARRSQ